MAYPDDITIDDDALDGGVARSLKTLAWLADQLLPPLQDIRDSSAAFNSYATTAQSKPIGSANGVNGAGGTALATRNLTLLKTSGGIITGLSGMVVAAYPLVFHFYDGAIIAPVWATDVPFDHFVVPAGAVFSENFIPGLRGGNNVGLGCAVTKVDGSAIAAGDFIGTVVRIA